MQSGRSLEGAFISTHTSAAPFPHTSFYADVSPELPQHAIGDTQLHINLFWLPDTLEGCI
eukprot:8106719-Alexandrium_andersonii.AAC.1